MLQYALYFFILIGWYCLLINQVGDLHIYLISQRMFLKNRLLVLLKSELLVG